MIRIGIVGSDNSHAIALSQLCNLRETEAQRKIRGARVLALYGRVPERNEEVAEKGQIPTIVRKPTDMLGQVDAAFVVFRHGGLHYRHAKPFLEARVPTFVDKPLACSTRDARRIIQLARSRRTLLTSFSTVRWAQATRDLVARCAELGGARSGVFAGPCQPDSEYGGIHFYGIHTVEVMQEVMGMGAASVSAVQTGPNTLASVAWRDGRNASVHLNADARSGFYAAAFCKEGTAGGPLDSSDCYVKGLQRILQMLKSRERPLSYAAMVEPIRVLDAVAKAVDTGQHVTLRKIKV